MTHTVFITGGASGIGFGIAEFLGQQGHRILVAHHKQSLYPAQIIRKDIC